MPSTISTNSIAFPNNRAATAVSPPAGATAREILDALGIKPHKAVLLIIGGADSIDEKLKPQLMQLFGRGIARAAVIVDAVIIDGGTAAGVMAMMGQGVADRCFQSTLVGVAPLGKVTYPGAKGEGDTQLDPNHSHFVLAEGDTWGSETSVIFKLVSALRSRGPAVVLLAGGGATTKGEALQAVRQNLPLFIVEGSGGLADEIAAAWKAKPKLPDDPVMAEIIADGRIEFYHLSNPVSDAERLLILALSGDNVLFQAWGQFAEYDMNANLQQTRFQWLQMAIIVVGILGTALALINQVYPNKDAKGNVVMTTWNRTWSIHYLLITVPIVLTMLITAANRFKQGNKWLLLRAGAEAIKREIYRYRARAGDYSDKGPATTAVGSTAPPTDASPGTTSTTTTPPPIEPKLPPPTPEQVLAQRVEDITRRTMRTEVNVSALKPYNKQKGFPPDMYAAQGGDDGLSVLTPNRYVQVRLGDQLAYYKRRAVKLERQLKVVQWCIFIVGGLGTLLAAINRQVWIALTTALAAALTTFLSYKQTESTLMKYNQAWTDLGNVKAWWTALPPEEQAKSANVTTLVDHTEQVLQSELDGWVQQMQNALAELRKGQEKAPETKDGAATPPTDAQQAATSRQEAETAAKKAGDGSGGGDKDVNKDANKVVDPNNPTVVVVPKNVAPAVDPGKAAPAVDPNKDASVNDAAKNTPKNDTGGGKP